jgi:hypothetical protein
MLITWMIQRISPHPHDMLRTYTCLRKDMVPCTLTRGVGGGEDCFCAMQRLVTTDAGSRRLGVVKIVVVVMIIILMITMFYSDILYSVAKNKINF